MSGINVAATMDALATAFVGVVGVRKTYAYPLRELRPGDACVGYPTTLDFDQTFGRGMDRVVFPVFVMCGPPHERATRVTVSGLITDGASDVKDVVEGNLGGVVSSVRVTDCAIELVNYPGDAQVVTARFDCEVLS